MKISLNWLKDYVDFDLDAGAMADLLSDRGFPLEGIEYPDGDAVIDVEVSSNRGDCLCHIGIAREVAAALGNELKLPSVDFALDDKDAEQLAQVQIDAPELCNRYTARVISGIKIGPSPDWMVKRLEALGVRSVNNVVDATNYAMMEVGQPTHAFDYDKLASGKIIVRNAVPGERITSIDETKCDLNDKMLVIADEKQPVAIAGVMGGLDTEINDATTTVLLEAAQFDPVSVRTTGRGLTISSEASFRFERHVDTELLDWTSKRTAALIVEVAGGKVAKSLVDAYPVKWQGQKVTMRLSRLNKLLGFTIPADAVMGIFNSLDLSPNQIDDDTVECTMPTWRHDITREVDLIEEVIRCYGYDKIPVEHKLNIEVAAVDVTDKVTSKIRSILNGCGYYETINITFVDDETAALFTPENMTNLAVTDASRKSTNVLRPSLLGSLFGVMKTNLNAGNRPCRIFELSDTFIVASDSKGLPIEKLKLGMASDCDFRQFRAVIENVIVNIKKDAVVDIKPCACKWAEAAAEIVVDGEVLGICGIVSDKVAKQFGISEMQICAAELDFESIRALFGSVVKVKPLPRFPSVTRDLSLIVDETVCWNDIADTVKSKATAELEDILFTGIYRGKPIASNKKSVTVSLRFRDEDGTLTHDVVDGFEANILDELKAKLSAELRTV